MSNLDNALVIGIIKYFFKDVKKLLEIYNMNRNKYYIIYLH